MQTEDRYTYDAFLSYSHERDADFGQQLQNSIERFGSPWNLARVRRVFRDNSNLTLTSNLWESIEHALANSRCLLLLSSPEAARSIWVEKEVQWWIDNRCTSTLYILLTDGQFEWDNARGMIGTDTTAIPPSLRAAMRTEPRLVDFRKLRNFDQAAKPAIWQARIGDIVAAIEGEDKDRIVGEHIRQEQRTARLIGSTMAVLTILLVAALTFAVIVFVQRDEAQRQAIQATARQVVAEAETLRDVNPGLASQLLVQAYRLTEGNASTRGLVLDALRRSAAIPAIIQGRNLVWEAAFSPDGRTLATASNAGLVIHDLATGEVVANLDEQAGSSRAVAYSSDGSWLAIGGADGALRVFDVADIDEPVLLTAEQVVSDSVVASVEFVGSSRTVAVGANNAAFGLWDLSSPANPQNISIVQGDPANSSSDLAISPDGRVVATASTDNNITLYDIATPSTPQVIAILSGHEGSVAALAFAPNGAVLASAGDDNTTRLWQVGISDPTAIAVFAGQSLFASASLAYSAGSSTLAIGGADGSIRLWDVVDPFRPVQGATLTGHTDPVRSLDFSPDGGVLASGSADGVAQPEGSYANGTVRLWPVDGSERTEGDPAAGAELAAGRLCAISAPITEPEWVSYLPDLPYDPPCNETERR